jgi:hypothetical protein
MNYFVRAVRVPALVAVLAAVLCLGKQTVRAANVEHHPLPGRSVASPSGMPMTGLQSTAGGYDMFGSPAAGQLFQPGPTMFGGSIQTGPAGISPSVRQAGGSTMFPALTVPYVEASNAPASK